MSTNASKTKQPCTLQSVNGCASHSWDKETGIKEPGKPWVGIKSRWVRKCTICGKKEYFANDGMFCGWFSVP